MKTSSISLAGVIVFGLFAMPIYFLPTIIAFLRENWKVWTALFLNPLFGRMLIGWVVTSVWSMLAKPKAFPPEFGSRATR